MKIPILMYHELELEKNLVSAIKQSHMHPSYIVSLEEFKLQLQLVSNLDISTITLDQLSNPAEAPDNSKQAVLTFDDGYIGNYLYAFPAIRNLGMTATFFCAVSLIGEKNMMTWSQLKEMSAEKMSIQSHSYSHRPLASLKKNEIYNDLKNSKLELENHLGREVSYLSLPHGSFNKYVINTAKEIGYKRICTSLVGYHRRPEYLLKRIFLGSGRDLNQFKTIITGQNSFFSEKIRQVMKTKIKNAIGHQNYLRIYHLFLNHKKQHNLN